MEISNRIEPIPGRDAEFFRGILAVDPYFNEYEFNEWVGEYCEGFDLNPLEVDLCGLALKWIAEGVCEELSETVASNACCSTFDIEPEKAKKLLKKIPKDERDEKWQWLWDFIGC